jgi:hypothetical protein
LIKCDQSQAKAPPHEDLRHGAPQVKSHAASNGWLPTTHGPTSEPFEFGTRYHGLFFQAPHSKRD